MTDLGQYWEAFQGQMGTVGPRLGYGVLVLMMGFGGAIVLRWVLLKGLLSASRTLERAGLGGGTRETTAYRLSNFVFWGVLALSVIAATDTLGIAALSDWLRTLGRFVPRVLVAVLLGGVGWVLAGVLRDIVERGAQAGGFTQSDLIARGVYFTVLAATTLVILRQLGIEVSLLTNGLLLVLGAFLFGGTLSFALGSRPVVTDILCSLSNREHMEEGDHFEMGEAKGTITRITATSIILKGEKGSVVVPAKLLGEQPCRVVRRGESS